MEKTFREFETLKNWKAARHAEQKLIKNHKSSNLWGCLALPFIKLGVKLGEKAYLEQSKRYDYQKKQKRARELLDILEIRNALCFVFHELDRKEIVTEEKMVKTIANSLVKEEVRNKFSIPLDEILFAQLSYELVQIGLENYCENMSE